VTCQEVTVLAPFLDESADPAFRAERRGAPAVFVGTVIRVLRTPFGLKHKALATVAAFGRYERAVGKVGTDSKAGAFFFNEPGTALRTDIFIVRASTDALYVIPAIQQFERER